MYGKYVLRAKEGEGRYLLEEIKPEVSLQSAVWGESLNCSIKYTIYRDLPLLVDIVFGTLTEREVEVLKYRFGFYGKFYSLREVGMIMDFSGERVRQIEKKALRKLRHPSRARSLYRVPERNDIVSKGDEIINFKDIIIKKIEAYISGYDSKVGFLKDIFENNEIFIEVGNSIAGTGAAEIALEDLEFDVRTYNCMKRSGANTMADLLALTEDDLMKVRNLGRKSAEKVLDRIRQYKAGEIRLSTNITSINKYISVKVRHQGDEQVYKFGRMSTTEMAECIFEVLVDECSQNGTIIDYEMSMELKMLLLIKGYFFVENMIKDSDVIAKELLIGTYEKYTSEFNTVVKRLKDCFDNEMYPEVAFIVVKNKVARNIINRNPKTREELFGCFKAGKEEEDKCLKQLLSDKFPLRFKIEISESISLKDIENEALLDLEDEQISAMVRSEEEQEDEEFIYPL